MYFASQQKINFAIMQIQPSCIHTMSPNEIAGTPLKEHSQAITLRVVLTWKLWNLFVVDWLPKTTHQKLSKVGNSLYNTHFFLCFPLVSPYCLLATTVRTQKGNYWRQLPPQQVSWCYSLFFIFLMMFVKCIVLVHYFCFCCGHFVVQQHVLGFMFFFCVCYFAVFLR